MRNFAPLISFLIAPSLCDAAENLNPFNKALPAALHTAAAHAATSNLKIADKVDEPAFWTVNQVQNSGSVVTNLTTQDPVNGGTLVLSQINDNCGAGTCPTKLFLVQPNGARQPYEIDVAPGQPASDADPTIAMLPQVIPDDFFATGAGLSGKPPISFDSANNTLSTVSGLGAQQTTRVYNLKILPETKP
jgi:hypothetical protein